LPGYAPEKRRKELWDQLSSFVGPLAGDQTLGTFSTLTDAECPMPSYPSVDESRPRLHRAGWSVGETAFGLPHAPAWQVDGANGENRLLAHERTQAEAWWRACEQAWAVGMLARVRR
jgi:hypothetical protein